MKTVGLRIPRLVAIVNNRFKQGLFPITLRRAIAKLLVKSDALDKDLLKNCRPVSNIAFVDWRKLQFIVCLIISLWMGCMKNKMLHSTETALLRIQRDIAGAFDKSHAPHGSVLWPVTFTLLTSPVQWNDMDYNPYVCRRHPIRVEKDKAHPFWGKHVLTYLFSS